MKDDAQKALEELQERLLSDDEDMTDDELLDQIIQEVHAGEKAPQPKEKPQPPRAAKTAKADRAKEKEDRVQTVLMFVASGLSLGISLLLIYWLVKYL